MLGEAHAGNGTTIRGAPVPRMTVDGYNETRGSALQRLTSVLTNARSQVASEVRKRMYSRRLGSARYPQIPAVLPGAAGKRRQGPVSSDRTPVALRVAQDLRRNTAAPRPSLRGNTVRMQCCWMWASLRRLHARAPRFHCTNETKKSIKSGCVPHEGCTSKETKSTSKVTSKETKSTSKER